MGANNSELALIGQFGAAKQYSFDDTGYTLIGPLPRSWYTIVALSTEASISPQSGSGIATAMDGDDASATVYAADALDRFCVNFEPGDTLPPYVPDDRYIAIKATSGAGTIKLRPMRIGVTLP
jgi:hypothetical protein